MPSQKNEQGKPLSFRTREDLTQQLTTTGKQLNKAGADFLRIDVQAGLTFAGLALGTDNKEKQERNRKNARKAYDTILRLSGRVVFTPGQEQHLREMMDRLKTDLND